MGLNRRDFLKTSFWAAVVAFTLPKLSWAAGKFRTPPPARAADPTKPGPAMAQKYAHFVGDYKGIRKPTFAANADCKNCNFFKPDKPGDAWGKCAMIGNSYVYEDGLCQIWIKKAGT